MGNKDKFYVWYDIDGNLCKNDFFSESCDINFFTKLMVVAVKGISCEHVYILHLKFQGVCQKLRKSLQ